MWQPYIHWFQNVLNAKLRTYFEQEVHLPPKAPPLLPERNEKEWSFLCKHVPDYEECVVLLLSLMPHLDPQVLDIFFSHNKLFDRPYTEFGGWKGVTHPGFLPTGETAVFLLAGQDQEKREQAQRLFHPDHWFRTNNILSLEGQGGGEPYLSGQLRLSEEFLNRALFHETGKPIYGSGFPAKRITTPLNWDDLVLPFSVALELNEINTWLTGSDIIMREWGLDRILKAGYRSLFYGPPGTGKTLSATLLGKRNNMDVYRIDLSMVVSKYIGETEKNLARVFDQAENRNWILFFDEADSLFGKRTAAKTSNDRYANQETAYLLQRIEDFPGTIILASNLKSNMDEAFTRRFQSSIYFPMPDEQQRYSLWDKMLPTEWIISRERPATLSYAAAYELSGGSITNVIRTCALQMLAANTQKLTREILIAALKKEQAKEGKSMSS